MRLSSLIFSTTALAGIRNEQSSIAKLSSQIANGQRVVAPKDDPVRAARIMELTDRIALRQQYIANQDKARLQLAYENTVIGEMRKVLEHARGLLMGVAPNHESAFRQQISDLITADYNQLKAMANTRDPSGNYIFSGHKTATQPYAHAQVAPDTDNNPNTHATSGSAAYNGDLGLRSIEIDVGRTVQVNDNLDTVMRTGQTDDLLQALDQVAIDLRETPGLLTQTDIDDGLGKINAALDRLGLIERRIAAAQLEVAATQTTTKALLNEEKNALGALVELDQAGAIIELQRRQVTLEAAQRAYARTAGLSLFDYL
ncbi:MAG: flagellin N-terminal helical domain-containing protein [Thiobacillaceae bacterium]